MCTCANGCAANASRVVVAASEVRVHLHKTPAHITITNSAVHTQICYVREVHHRMTSAISAWHLNRQFLVLVQHKRSFQLHLIDAATEDVVQGSSDMSSESSCRRVAIGHSVLLTVRQMWSCADHSWLCTPSEPGQRHDLRRSPAGADHNREI